MSDSYNPDSVAGKIKRCSRCKIEKDRSVFGKNRSTKDGLQDRCKTCRKESNQRDYQSHKTKRLEQQRVYQQTLAYKESKRKSRSTIRSHLQQVFNNMKKRCTDPEVHNYSRYGGRDIRVLFVSSNEFIDYVIHVLQVDPRGLTIDRINNDGNYEPGNIRFVSQAENNQNQSRKELLLV